MMREKARERGSDFFGRGKRSVESKGHRKGDDFRGKLFSIHIDNINPVVDQMGLWSMFKPFGRVRDVYLSSKNSPRRSLYAFIRFETMDEAVKVARLKNGMHVYGWPIVSKVVAFGWNRRRSVEDRNFQSGVRHHPVSKRMEVEVEEEDRSSEVFKYKEKSFAEVLRGNKTMKGKQDYKTQEQAGGDSGKVLSMFWSRNPREEQWLRRCAVVTLKSFANVENVNIRLADRAFSFSAHYIRDKSVLWHFDSELDKEGFINNRFFLGRLLCLNE